ncbi:MAG: putative lipoprotein, partial [Myxococcaceae bacterium]|nr:putative lipoprotein [Myxococcaceae bacterium]
MSPRAVLLLVIAACAVLPGCGNKPPDKPPLGPETCDNKKDDNGDGKVDCADPKCFKVVRCLGAGEVCDNGADDNGDGKADCLDPMCNGQSCGSGCACVATVASENDCSDLTDNDGDGKTDCLDPDCQSAAACSDGGSGGGSGSGGGAGVGGGSAGGSGGGSAGGSGGG